MMENVTHNQANLCNRQVNNVRKCNSQPNNPCNREEKKIENVTQNQVTLVTG